MRADAASAPTIQQSFCDLLIEYDCATLCDTLILLPNHAHADQFNIFLLFKLPIFSDMPVLINGKMCLPIGGRVHQLDSKDARIAAVAMTIPLLLTLAGLISCGTGIVSEQLVIFSDFFGSFQATAIVGYHQIHFMFVGPNGIQAVDQTGYVYRRGVLLPEHFF